MTSACQPARPERRSVNCNTHQGADRFVLRGRPTSPARTPRPQPGPPPARQRTGRPDERLGHFAAQPVPEPPPLEHTRELAEQLLRARDPYEIGLQFMGETVDVITIGEYAGSMYLLWGALGAKLVVDGGQQ
jgi:hypothetical protein